MSVSTELERLRELLREAMPALADQYGVASLGLFGSYVRHENTADSDLDVLVTFRQNPSLFRFIELENRLSDLVGTRVDLVMRDSLKPSIGSRIFDELLPI